MTTRPPLPVLLALALALAASAHAQAPAAPDTSLRGYLGQFADSTDRYFGTAAAPPDTAGLDSVLADTARPHGHLDWAVLPVFRFERVDGPVWGASASLRDAPRLRGHNGWGKLEGDLERAGGSGTLLGGARYNDRLWLGGQPFDLGLWAGRATATLNRDDAGRLLPTLRALVFGDDWSQYLRADGFTAALAHQHAGWRAGVDWSDLLQSPLATTAGWNLAGRALERPANLAAARGRAHELGLSAAVHWPHTPLRTEFAYQTSSRRLGSDFEYRRTRVAAGLELPVARVVSLVPQFAWGRVRGDAVPQAAFYLGADATLRSLHRDERAGSGFAIAKLDLVSAGDLLATLHLPHAAAFPIQGALFAATSAVWGPDPYGGPTVAGVDWPDRNAWASEVGASLLYSSPLLFPGGGALRVSYAWPIGPDTRVARWSVSISRALDLLDPEPEPGE